MSNQRDRNVSPSRRRKRASRGRNLAVFLSVSALVVVVVLLSCSPWKGAAGRDGASSAANSLTQSIVLQNGTPGSTSSTTAPTPTKKSKHGKVKPTTDSSTTATASSKTATAPTTPTLTAVELEAKVDALVDAVPAHVAVEIGLADGTTLYEHEPDTLFDAASLYKLGIMVEVYKQRDDGDLTFDDPVTLYPGYFYEEESVYAPDSSEYADVSVGELLQSMITLSSNVAAQALLELVGTDQVNATMAELGLANTQILWTPEVAAPGGAGSVWVPVDPGHSAALVPLIARAFPEDATLDATSSSDGAYDVTTAGDMAHLFEQLVSGAVLSKSDSDAMLTLLSQQEINDRIPASLPAGTRVAHKTGDLDALLHDAGVIYAPRGPIVVVILSDDITDHDAMLDLMRQIALLAYEYQD